MYNNRAGSSLVLDTKEIRLKGVPGKLPGTPFDGLLPDRACDVRVLTLPKTNAAAVKSNMCEQNGLACVLVKRVVNPGFLLLGRIISAATESSGSNTGDKSPSSFVLQFTKWNESLKESTENYENLPKS